MRFSKNIFINSIKVNNYNLTPELQLNSIADAVFTGTLDLGPAVKFMDNNIIDLWTKNINNTIEENNTDLASSQIIKYRLNDLRYTLLYSFNNVTSTGIVKYVLPKGVLFYGDTFNIDFYLSFAAYTATINPNSYIYNFGFSIFFDPNVIELYNPDTSIGFVPISELENTPSIFENVINRKRMKANQDFFLENEIKNSDGNLTEQKITAYYANEDDYNLPINASFKDMFICSVRYRVKNTVTSHTPIAFDRCVIRDIVENIAGISLLSSFGFEGDKIDTKTGQREKLAIIDDIENNSTKKYNGMIRIGNYQPLNSIIFNNYGLPHGTLYVVDAPGRSRGQMRVSVDANYIIPNISLPVFKIIGHNLTTLSRNMSYDFDFYIISTGPDNYSLTSAQFSILFNTSILNYNNTTTIYDQYTYNIVPPGVGTENTIVFTIDIPPASSLLPKLTYIKLLSINMTVKGDAPTGSQIVFNKGVPISLLDQDSVDYTNIIEQEVTGEKRIILGDYTLTDLTFTITT